MEKRKPELLAPAANLEVLKTAVRYGADAVYIGGMEFGLRAKADNFTREEMAEAISFAHVHGVKIHVTVNILAHNSDLPGVREYLKELSVLGPDALIIADPGIFTMAREICPEIDIHVSTQANNTNIETYRFWHRLGAKRVVAARELSLDELREIRQHIPEDLEIESFIHGAMCISYSGRCLLSNYFTGRDANHGECAHPCRWNYSVVEETRPGEFIPVYENERGTYIFSSRDLCMIGHIPDLADAGISSLKIEGRMKTALYVATVTRAYRMAIDDNSKSPELYKENLHRYNEEVAKCTHRPYSTGFYYGKPKDEPVAEEETYVNQYRYLGTILDVRPDGFAHFEQKNKFCVGDTIELMKPDGRDLSLKVLEMEGENGEPMDSCPHASQQIYVRLSEVPEPYDIMRIKAS